MVSKEESCHSTLFIYYSAYRGSYCWRCSGNKSEQKQKRYSLQYRFQLKGDGQYILQKSENTASHALKDIKSIDHKEHATAVSSFLLQKILFEIHSHL